MIAQHSYSRALWLYIIDRRRGAFCKARLDILGIFSRLQQAVFATHPSVNDHLLKTIVTGTRSCHCVYLHVLYQMYNNMLQ